MTDNRVTMDEYRKLTGQAVEAKEELRDKTENCLQSWITNKAEGLGWLVFHPFNNKRNTSGYPDLTMVRNDRIVFAELKKMGGRLSAEQKQWIESLKMAQAEVYVWYPIDLEEILKILE